MTRSAVNMVAAAREHATELELEKQIKSSQAEELKHQHALKRQQKAQEVAERKAVREAAHIQHEKEAEEKKAQKRKAAKEKASQQAKQQRMKASAPKSNTLSTIQTSLSGNLTASTSEVESHTPLPDFLQNQQSSRSSRSISPTILFFLNHTNFYVPENTLF
ncbi:hypothetical protein DIZ76_015651 [Coccidioides immitis]|nr:hypothetical protein DIZ76_015651 [Coccidioides immitis]